MNIKSKNNKQIVEYQRGGKRYHFVARAFNENGEFTDYATKTSEAEDAYALHRASIILGYDILTGEKLRQEIEEENKNRIKLRDFIKLYIDTHKFMIENLTNCERYLNYFADHIAIKYDLKQGEDKFVDEILRIDLTTYVQYRKSMEIMVKKKDGLHPTGKFPKNSTVNRECNSIKGMFSWGVEEKPLALPINPFVRFKELKTKTPRRVSLSKIQYNLLERELKGSILGKIITLFVNTGMRLSELIELVYDESVHLETSKEYPYGYFNLINTKTNVDRIIPMTAKTREIVESLPRDSEYLITNPKTGTCYKNLYSSIKTLFKRAGIYGENVGFHVFRRTFAKFLEEKGVPVSVIQDLLGHKNIKTTEKYLNQKGLITFPFISKLSEEKNKKVVHLASKAV